MRVLAPAYRRLALACGLSLAVFAAPSHAFSDDEARRSLNSLREQVNQMAEQNNRARLQLASQLQALQQEVMQLRGQLELVARQQPASCGPQQNPNNPAGVQANDPQEQAAFDGAIDQFRTGQYQPASEALASFISLYPNSPLAPTTLFYQGSSRYALKDFKGAISQMQALVPVSYTHLTLPTKA